MELHQQHQVPDLFSQLGLDNGEQDINAFIRDHHLQPRDGELYRAIFWNPAQAQFIKQADLDGSVTGIPDSQVLLHDGENDSVVTDDSCEIHPTWNASVCTGDIGRLNLSDARGELPATVDLESRTARFVLLSSIGGTGADDPIALVRNGKEFKIFGDESTVKAGTEKGKAIGRASTYPA